MNTRDIKKVAITTLFLLAACSSTKQVKDGNPATENLRASEIGVSPSILRVNANDIVDNSQKTLFEDKKSLSLNVSDVPDLGGINESIDNAKETLELHGEPVTFVADQLSIKEFSNKVFNELLNINYVLSPELAASKTSLTLNISTPISRTDFYASVNETLTQNQINSYRKGNILYLAKQSSNNKKNNIALGIGASASSVPDISGQITHIVPYTYSESRNITSIMQKLATARVTINSAQKLIILEGEREEVVRALKIINMLDVPRAFGRKNTLI